MFGDRRAQGGLHGSLGMMTAAEAAAPAPHP